MTDSDQPPPQPTLTAEWRVALHLSWGAVHTYSANSEEDAWRTVRRFPETAKWVIERRMVTPWSAVGPRSRTVTTYEAVSDDDPGASHDGEGD